MRLIFLGTPQFAVPALEKTAEAGHQMLAVFTQPDRPKGRGRENAMSPVKEVALRLGLPVHQPERIRRQEAVDQLSAMDADAMVVVGYGQIIPQTIIDLAPLGIINVHASLLPKYRGAAPIQWAIANGEASTGVTTMRIDAGLDTGEMLLKEETRIGPEEDAPQLGARLARMGADLLVRTLEGLRLGTLAPVKQNPDEATYAPILRKEDGLIDWRRSASEIHNRGRGFLPWPGTYTTFRGQLLHIWKAKPANDINLGLPGSIQIRNRRVLVASGHETVLELFEMQLEGRKRVSAEAFRNGQRLIENEVLGEITN